MSTNPYYIDATGNVGGANGGEVHSVVLTAGSDAATLTLRSGGSGGAVFLVLKAATNTTTAHTFACAAAYYGQLHATLAGTGPVATIEV